MDTFEGVDGILPQPLYPPTVEAPERPLPLLRFLATFVRNPLLTLPKSCYEAPMTLVTMGTGRGVWVTDPDLIEDILVTHADAYLKSHVEKRVFARTLREGVLSSDGAQWRWQRRALAPMFRHSEILHAIPTLAEASAQHVANWATPAVREIDAEMQAVTFRIIARILLETGEPDDAQLLLASINEMTANISWEAAWAIARFPNWLPHPRTWKLNRVGRKMREQTRTIIAKRRAEGSGRADLLDRLMAAADPDTGAPMDDDSLVDNVLTMLAAGHDTTAHAMTFALYLLAIAPEWQSRVRDEVFGTAGTGTIGQAHLNDLKVTRQVIQEAMRLYPSVPVLARQPAREVEIGGVAFGPGDQVVIPIFCLHRHRKLWDDPDRFDPTRFADEHQYRRTQYMPFGAGPRICIGQSLAMVEATVMLATFVRAAHFEWAGHHTPTPVSRLTLRPEGGMPLRVAPLT